jgi:hypothetical protein
MPQVLARHDPLLPLVTRVLDLGLYAMHLGRGAVCELVTINLALQAGCC